MNNIIYTVNSIRVISCRIKSMRLCNDIYSVMMWVSFIHL